MWPLREATNYYPWSPIRIPPFLTSPKGTAWILDATIGIGIDQAKTGRSLKMTRPEGALHEKVKPTKETKHANLYQTDSGVGWHAWSPGKDTPKAWRECISYSPSECYYTSELLPCQYARRHKMVRVWQGNPRRSGGIWAQAARNRFVKKLRGRFAPASTVWRRVNAVRANKSLALPPWAAPEKLVCYRCSG
jgi:hypothetical protein